MCRFVASVSLRRRTRCWVSFVIACMLMVPLATARADASNDAIHQSAALIKAAFGVSVRDNVSLVPSGLDKLTSRQLHLREIDHGVVTFELAWNDRGAAVGSWSAGRAVIVLFIHSADGSWSERQRLIASSCDTPGTLLKGLASLVLTKCPAPAAEFCAFGGAALAISDIYSYLGCQTLLNLANQPNSPLLAPGPRMGTFCDGLACQSDIFLYTQANGYPETAQLSATWWEVFPDGGTKALARTVENLYFDVVAPNVLRNQDTMTNANDPEPCPSQFVEFHYYIFFPNGATATASYAYANQDSRANGAGPCA